MKEFGKLGIVLSIMQRIAEGLYGISGEVKRFNDILEGLSTGISRYNDLHTSLRAERIKDKAKTKQRLPDAAVKARASKRMAVGVEQPVPAKKEKRRSGLKRKEVSTSKRTQTIPDILYKSIIAISNQKPEFAPGEVIDRAAKSIGGAVKKDSVRTALQGFKVGSKTANRLQSEYRDLIAPVKGERGLYRLNPDKG